MSEIKFPAAAIDIRFSETFYMVKSNRNEHLHLWDRFHEMYTWKENSGGAGLILTLGTLDNRRIEVQFIWDEIGGKKICFWEAVSNLVDYDLINKWMDHHIPYDNVPRAEASDFTNVLYRVGKPNA